MHVAARGRAIAFVQYSIPRDAAAGEYHITHAIRAPGLDADIETRATIVVRSRRSVTVALIDEPYFAAAGSIFRAGFLVSNNGNVRTRVRLHTRTEQDVSARVDTLTELAPGERREVNVWVEAGAGSSTEESRHRVALIADVEGGVSTDGKAAPAAVASVRVVPRSGSAGMPLFSLPISLSLNSTQALKGKSFVGDNSRSFELSASGQLTEGGNTSVDLFARGPQNEQIQFGQREEYRLGVSGTHYAVRVGDQLFRLSALSDGGTIASGVSGSINLGRFVFGGEWVRDRQFSGGVSQQGGFAGYNVSDRLYVGANVLERNDFSTGIVGSFYARAKLTSKSIFEFEQGRGLLGDGAGAMATIVRAAGDHGWLAFDAQHMSVDSSYLTGIRGVGRDLANVTIRPFRWFRIAGRAEELTRDYQRTLFNINTLHTSSDVTHNFNVSADFAGILAAGVRSSAESTDPPADPTLNINGVERSAWARMSLRLWRLSASGTREQGTYDDRSGAPVRPFTVTRVQAGLRVTSFSSVAAYVSRSTGQRRLMPSAQDEVIAGASAQIQAGRVGLSVAGTTAPSSRFHALPDSNWMLPGAVAALDGTATLALSAGRSLSLRVHTVSTGATHPLNTVAQVAYNMPITLPIGRSRTQGRVMGRVYDAETGAGISNALVRIGGRSALTDEEGRVAFGGVSPSRYPVFVDLGPRQLDGAGFEDASLEVSPQAGHTTVLGVRVTRMGRVFGTISLFERVDSVLRVPDNKKLRKSRGLPGIVVSLMNGSEERRVLTNADGVFELRDARPGMWRVVVSAAQLPAQTYVDGDTVRVVDLEVGGSQGLEINVIPRDRKILPLDDAPIKPIGPIIPPAPRSIERPGSAVRFFPAKVAPAASRNSSSKAKAPPAASVKKAPKKPVAKRTAVPATGVPDAAATVASPSNQRSAGLIRMIQQY